MNKVSIHPPELTPDLLRLLCKPDSLGFNTTDDLPDLTDVIGQPRALRALELGSEVSGPGYNTFVIGQSGSGRTTLSLEYLQRIAAGQPTPDDWCYVNNFSNPRQPKALRLPAGKANAFRQDMESFINTCQREIPRRFESEEYTKERDRMVAEYKKKQEAEFIRLQEQVEENNFLIARTPVGFVLAPAVGGKPLTPEELEKLSQEQREKLSKLQIKLSDEVDKSLNRMKEMEKSIHETISNLDEQTLLYLLSPLFGALETKYAGLDSVVNFLQAIKDDILENLDNFRASQSANPNEPIAVLQQRDWSRRYLVNVLVDHKELKGAPVLLESYPTYNNLMGRIEHEVSMGLSRTDFTLIQAGSMHRANGGFLVVPARDLLINPYAWEGLKRVLRDSEIRMTELANQLGLISTVTLEPEPIPLNIKVFLVGTPMLYYLLRAYDEDFSKLFKVRAEFATTMERNPETEHEYGLFVKSVVVDNHLPPFDRDAVARIIEYSARLAEDQNRLSTRFGKIADLVREAAYWARKDAAKGDGEPVLVSRDAVQHAIEENIFRSDLIEERIQDMIAKGTILITLTGKAVGQINALSVISLGDYAFGRPSRVTAIAHPGRQGIVDIERVAKLGGPIHTKGVLILSGLLGQRYGQEQPLSMTASLAFEQSYEGIEGDSASAAEFFVLLSAISGVPLRQDLAITGSINQHGQIQAIGGVNEKIEGFFYTCRQGGLTGEQGVIIPASNIPHLMLSEQVAEAVSSGQFHIWAIQSIDEGIALLTGIDPGERQPDGAYPEGSVNSMVMERLMGYAKSVARFSGNGDPRPGEARAQPSHTPENDQ